jgi:hypothetical protein
VIRKLLKRLKEATSMEDAQAISKRIQDLLDIEERRALRPMVTPITKELIVEGINSYREEAKKALSQAVSLL